MTDAIVAATENCTYCPTLCLHACPVLTAEADDVVSPWGKMSLARWVALGRAELTDESAAVFYKCTDCGACSDACKHGAPVADTLKKARRSAIDEGVNPHPAESFTTVVEASDAASFPPGVSGAALASAGHHAAFQAVARAAAKRWDGQRQLVFESAQDRACVAEDWSAAGVTTSATTTLAALVGPVESAPGPVAYFEACRIARGDAQEATALRERAAMAAGGELVELRWRGKAATCCGAGGAYAETSPEGAATAARRILESAVAKGARTLVTGCGGCSAHLASAVGDLPIAVRRL